MPHDLTPCNLTRRELLSAAALTAAVVSLPDTLLAQTTSPSSPSLAPAAARLQWLEKPPADHTPPVTFTVPFPLGSTPPSTTFTLTADDNTPLPAQTWPLAYWPDGSLKWAAVTLAPSNRPSPAHLTLTPGPATPPSPPSPPSPIITISDRPDALTVDTGVLRATFPRSGPLLLSAIERAGKPALTNARLLAFVQNGPSDELAVTRESLESDLTSVAVEHTGPVRTVVRIDGVHRSASRRLLPFTLRVYLHAGSDRLRLVHTFIYDGDESKDFLAGLGVRFDVPMNAPTHDRHVRFVGDGQGVFAEAVRGLTGLRRDPGAAVRAAQLAGAVTPPLETWAPSLRNGLTNIPEWGDYTLSQLSADGYTLRKRTKPGHAWVACNGGRRAAGIGYVGTPAGGVAFGLRDFWQRHPTRLDVRAAATDAAQVTLWLYAPDAPAMDLRFYHDGLGQDTYARQNVGLDITYEDYEPGYGTPHGIARTSELFLHVAPATPSREALAAFADSVRNPPALLCEPQRYLDAAVFGGIWTLPDTSTPVKASLEGMLTQVVEQYIREVDQRRWYGFWDYGDVMHTHDADRHCWRYDVGGFAWDNSELSPDLFFWTMVLRTGRADFYRFAEAHVRHTGEVDVYHLGRFAGLGTRHNVQHWGCSSKQTRISTSIYRRIFYFLTADERTGDLLRAQVNEGETFKKIVIGRKVNATPTTPSLPLPAVENPPPGGKVACGAMGWGNILSAWLTEAERTGNPAFHDRIRKSLTTIARLPKGLFTSNWQLDLDTGEVSLSTRPQSAQAGESASADAPADVDVSHLTACFGLPEISAELIATYPDEGRLYAPVFASYGVVYNGTNAEREAALGRRLRGFALNDSHSRITAFAARLGNDPALARRAWREYFGNPEPRRAALSPRQPVALAGPQVLNPISEIPLGTNGAQFWLATLQNLHYIGEYLPADFSD